MPGRVGRIPNEGPSALPPTGTAAMHFLRLVGEAILAQGLRGLMGVVPLGEKIYDVANDAVQRYRKEKRERA